MFLRTGAVQTQYESSKGLYNKQYIISLAQHNAQFPAQNTLLTCGYTAGRPTDHATATRALTKNEQTIRVRGHS